MPTLHIHGQQFWHDDVTIIGTEKALTQLQHLIAAAKTRLGTARSQHKQEQPIDVIGSADNASPDAESLFASDGEGYFANVVCLPEDDARWEKLAMPYHDVDNYRIKDDELVWTHKGFVEYGSFSRGHEPQLSVEAKIANWLLNKDTGSSSETLAALALGATVEDGDVPCNAGDLGRCYRLIQAVPEVINRILIRPLEEIGCQKIMPFIWQWRQLAKMYETYLAEDKDRDSENSILLDKFITVLRECDGDADMTAKALDEAKYQVELDNQIKAETEAKRLAFAEKSKADYDALPAIKKRPKLDDVIIRAGAQLFIQDHFKSGSEWLMGCADSFADAVVKEWNHDDGWSFADKLKRNGWVINRDEAEELDSLSVCIHDALKQAQKAWLTENNIAAPFPIGTYVKFNHGRDALEGVIKEVESHRLVGQYLIEVDACFNFGNGRPVVNWEDVEPIGLVV